MADDGGRASCSKKGWQCGGRCSPPMLFDRSIQNADAFTEPFRRVSVTEWCWGEVWNRPGLDKKTRSLINLAMLTALNRPNEVRLHVRGALNNSVTREEIQEVLLHTTVYCGVPAPKASPSPPRCSRRRTPKTGEARETVIRPGTPEDADRRRPRHDADPRLGVELLSAGDLGRADRRRAHVSKSMFFGFFSVSLLLQAALGPAIGRAIDRRGGRGMLMASNLVLAAGLVSLGLAGGPLSSAAPGSCSGSAWRSGSTTPPLPR